MNHSAFRFKPSHPGLSAPQIAAIRRRAVANESVLDIPVFSGEWPASKAQVVELLQGIETGRMPLAVYAARGSEEEHLGVAKARQRLQLLRGIALEQDMQAQLEAGHIGSPEEYTPLPEDEA